MSAKPSKEARQVLKECWELYEHAKRLRAYLFERAALYPILWFGDHVAYGKSALKVVTLGLNPSSFEYEDRFGNGVDAYDRLAYLEKWDFGSKLDKEQAMYTAYNEYFKHPYSRYFRPYEYVLRALGCTYGLALPGKAKAPAPQHTALHIDISPLTTAWRWSAGDVSTFLLDECRAKEGLRRLVLDFLRPDIVVLAMGKEVRAVVREALDCGEEETLGAGDTKRNYFYFQTRGVHPCHFFAGEHPRFSFASSREWLPPLQEFKGRIEPFLEKIHQ